MNPKIKELVKKLFGSDKEILKIATSAVYLKDNSDYIRALYEIIYYVYDGVINDTNDCNSELFDLLNKESED